LIRLLSRLVYVTALWCSDHELRFLRKVYRRATAAVFYGGAAALRKALQSLNPGEQSRWYAAWDFTLEIFSATLETSTVRTHGFHRAMAAMQLADKPVGLQLQ
jgi:hypothetical protein